MVGLAPAGQPPASSLLLPSGSLAGPPRLQPLVDPQPTSVWVMRPPKTSPQENTAMVVQRLGGGSRRKQLPAGESPALRDCCRKALACVAWDEAEGTEGLGGSLVPGQECPAAALRWALRDRVLGSTAGVGPDPRAATAPGWGGAGMLLPSPVQTLSRHFVSRKDQTCPPWEHPGHRHRPKHPVPDPPPGWGREGWWGIQPGPPPGSLHRPRQTGSREGGRWCGPAPCLEGGTARNSTRTSASRPGHVPAPPSAPAAARRRSLVTVTSVSDGPSENHQTRSISYPTSSKRAARGSSRHVGCVASAAGPGREPLPGGQQQPCAHHGFTSPTQNPPRALLTCKK